MSFLVLPLIFPHIKFRFFSFQESQVFLQDVISAETIHFVHLNPDPVCVRGLDSVCLLNH